MKFEVDTIQLASDTESLRESLRKISDCRMKMYDAIRALDRMWKGAAHDTYVAQCEKDEEQMKALIQEITAVINNIGTARENYDKCEESVKEIAGQIRI